MTTYKEFSKKLWNDLVALQKFQINLIRSEKFNQENFENEELPREETWNEHDLSRREMRQQERDYPHK